MRTVTGMGGLGNARELAELLDLLAKQGRGPDTELAHVTPEERAMLEASGGSGRINPNTGLREFQPEVNPTSFEDYYYAPNDYLAQARAAEPPGYYGTSQTGFNQAVDAVVNKRPLTERMNADTVPFGYDLQSFDYTGSDPVSAQRVIDRNYEALFQRGNEFPAETARLQEYAQGLRTPQEVEPELLDRITGALKSAETGYREFKQEYPMLERLLGTTAASLPAILAARRSRREGSRAAAELRALGAPLREEGEALRKQALSGGLTPQQARQQEARKAQLLQGATTRDSTSGTQEAMIGNVLQRERATTAESNLNQAIKQLNLANAYDEAAIRAKLASNTRVNDLLASIIGDLVRTTAGQQRGKQRTTSQGQTQSIMPEEPITVRPKVG